MTQVLIVFVRCRGSVIVDDGVRVKGPEDGQWFGAFVDVNQQFMVVSGVLTNSVYVYQSYSPYDMMAQFSINGYVSSLEISDDNTIAVSHYSNHGHWLTIYQYDGSSTWSIAQKFKLEKQSLSLAVYGDVLVVGLPNPDEGIVRGEWEQGQTIKQDGVRDFALSVAIYGQHMAVSAYSGHVLTYMLDQHSNTWISNGKYFVPCELPYVSIRNNLMVATVNDMKNHPDECGIVYKLTETTSNNNKNNNNGSFTATKSNNNNNIWVEFARLTTKGDPMTSDHQRHRAVSIEGQYIFTGRWDERGEVVGKVFLHQLPNYNNGQN